MEKKKKGWRERRREVAKGRRRQRGVLVVTRLVSEKGKGLTELAVIRMGREKEKGLRELAVIRLGREKGKGLRELVVIWRWRWRKGGGRVEREGVWLLVPSLG